MSAKPAWAPAFETYAEKLLAPYQIPGVSLAVAREGELIYHQGFGLRDTEEGLPLTLDTVMGIGSITKSFTCVAIMQLHEQGKLNIHDPVVKYLPEFRTNTPAYTGQISIHHFMTHTSGLAPLPILFRSLYNSMKDDPAARERLEKRTEQVVPVETYEELMEAIAQSDIPMLGAPGTHFSYSNDGYALLGAIIERVSGKSYVQYMDDHILKPAGMTRSTLDLQRLAEWQDVTQLYAVRVNEGKEEVFPAPGWWQAPAMLAAGFLRCSTRDMLRYAEIYRTGGLVGGERILSEESVRLMTTPYAQPSPGMHYGYGLMLTPEYHGVSLVEHGGALKGIAAWFTAVPEKGLTGVCLTNLAGGPSSQLLLGALNAELGLPPATTRVAFKDQAPGSLEAYLGTYRSGEDEELKVLAEDGKMVVEYQGRKWPARPVGEHTFAIRVKELESAARFLFDADRQVYAVAFHYRIIRKIA
ncbi:MAG: serine hydrolase domain-containing protein [Bacillota bacterium]